MVTALAMNTDDYVIWFTVGEDREITGPIGATLLSPVGVM